MLMFNAPLGPANRWMADPAGAQVRVRELEPECAQRE